MQHKKKNKISLIVLFIPLLLSLGMKKPMPKTVYHVYLKGKSIGLIKSKDNLERYIDKEQESLKSKYNIKKVYVPDELDIKKEITYSDDISSSEEIYTKIKDISSFSIDGYEINIKAEIAATEENKAETKNIKIYVIDKSIFTKSIDKIVRSFVTSEDYNTYKSDKKQVIKDTGKIIEKIYIENDITIKKGKISTNKKIYQEVDELSRYLLFGTLKSQATYTIKDGDTISDIAYNNKMSNSEFLIINPDFTSENALLYPGKTVNIGILNPQINIIELNEVVAYEEKKYQTEIRYDNTKTVGYKEVTQQGVNGKNKVTQKIKKVNGIIATIISAKTDEITPVVNEIIVKGGKEDYYTGSPVPTGGDWGWPATCNSISSGFGYRWGTLHDGTDIAGCGRNSAIYATQAGTVITVSQRWPDGKFVVIDHHNGYYTLYAHMNSFAVKSGQQVEKGQVIGGMGDTGLATGVHVHYAIWVGGPPYSGGRVLNAMSMY